jgi:AraC-like DNA-binding protein
VSLQKLSEVSGLSPAHISRRFKKVFGVSPVAWLTRHRIEKAKVMLAAGDSVTRTAHRCGFEDMHYFSTLFHKHAGVPPSRYAVRP